MSFGNGIAPVHAPEQRNGKITLRIHPLVATIVFSLLSLLLGMVIDSARSSAEVTTTVETHSEQLKQMVTRDQFDQFQNDTKADLLRIETELDQIRGELAKSK